MSLFFLPYAIVICMWVYMLYSQKVWLQTWNWKSFCYVATVVALALWSIIQCKVGG